MIDMGETAEAPVEGEEANADKPEEDGELDEDFILPEEGELPAEDAEPEIPEIDFSTLQVVIGEPQYDEDVMTLRATLIGFDNIDYALQWQFSTDDATWTDVPGATGDTLVVQLDESNAGCYWRGGLRLEDAPDRAGRAGVTRPLFRNLFLEAAHRLPQIRFDRSGSMGNAAF